MPPSGLSQKCWLSTKLKGFQWVKKFRRPLILFATEHFFVLSEVACTQCFIFAQNSPIEGYNSYIVTLTNWKHMQYFNNICFSHFTAKRCILVQNVIKQQFLWQISIRGHLNLFALWEAFSFGENKHLLTQSTWWHNLPGPFSKFE